VVSDVIGARGDVSVIDAPAILADVPGVSAAHGMPDMRCPDACGAYAQFWPHRHGTDAIFLALLRREPPSPGHCQ
jgi:16S rRNA (cytosine967-C5)-methyltransferase